MLPCSICQVWNQYQELHRNVCSKCGKFGEVCYLDLNLNKYPGSVCWKCPHQIDLKE